MDELAGGRAALHDAGALAGAEGGLCGALAGSRFFPGGRDAALHVRQDA